jgi:hypothetical protein
MPFFNLTSRGGGTGVIGGRSRGVKSFLLRQVITRGYLVGGYINSQPWTNVNYIQHSTDSAVDQGNLISSAGGYIGSSHNANRHFVWNTGGMGGYSTASSYNMRTNVNTGDFSMPQTYDDSEGMQSSDPVTGFGMMAYVFGNSTTISKFNLATEGFAGTIGSSALNDSNAGHHYGENYGYVWNGSGTTTKFTYATEAQSGVASAANHHQQKGHSSKIGFGWAGNEGSYNGGNAFRKWNYATDSVVSNHSKPIANSGEENLDMGQAHAYMLGMFDGAQNNRAWRWNYSTDSGFEGSSTMQPRGSGISGRSSGACAWRD